MNSKLSSDCIGREWEGSGSGSGRGRERSEREVTTVKSFKTNHVVVQ
jgi:hypothetical protein